MNDKGQTFSTILKYFFQVVSHGGCKQGGMQKVNLRTFEIVHFLPLFFFSNISFSCFKKGAGVYNDHLFAFDSF